jgi:serpin B
MRRFISCLNILLALALLTACAAPATASPTSTPGSSASKPLPATIAVSNKPRITNPAVQPADINQLVSGNSAFAFDLYQALLDPNTTNLFFSPYSISVALAMTQAGARGDTLAQMNQVMHYSLPDLSLHQAFNSLQLDLAKRQKSTDQPGQNDFQLNVANATWGQNGYSFLPAYLDVLAENYGAGLRLIDFKSDPEGARQLINDWVAQQTAQKIKDLIPQGNIDPLTRLVLTNAIYFNAGWMNTFNARQTAPGNFNNLDGKQVNVPMMNQEAQFNYYSGDTYQALELPYAGDKLSMLVLMPEAGQFANFEKSLDLTQVEAIRKNLGENNLRLTFPKFKVESSFSLSDTLAKMGMVNAFDPTKADFSGMDGTHDLSITGIVHKAYVTVDENGTEAAAATAVTIGVTSMPVDVIELKIDRPFIYLIQDNETGAILFIGRVTTL